MLKCGEWSCKFISAPLSPLKLLSPCIAVFCCECHSTFLVMLWLSGYNLVPHSAQGPCPQRYCEQTVQGRKVGSERRGGRALMSSAATISLCPKPDSFILQLLFGLHSKLQVQHLLASQQRTKTWMTGIRSASGDRICS